MGRLYHRKDSPYWWADFYNKAGERCQESTKTTDKGVARAKLRDFEMATTDSGPVTSPSLIDALAYFIDTVCAKRSSKTRDCYRTKSRHLLRLLLEPTKLDDLKIESFEHYVATRLNEGAHPGTIHKELCVVRGALKSARKRGQYHGSLEIVPPIDPEYEPRRTYLTFDQFKALMPCLALPAPPKASAATILKVQRLCAKRAFYCVLIAYASPRRGELEAMEWDGVNLATSMITIPRGKGKKSRENPMSDELRPWLQAFGDQAGWRGRVVDPWSNVGRDLPDACRRAGVPRVTPNDLRRTFASWLVQQRESLFVVATLMGHCNTRMVEKVYGRLDHATLAGAIAKLPADQRLRAVPPPATAPAADLESFVAQLAPDQRAQLQQLMQRHEYVTPRVPEMAGGAGFAGPSAIAAVTNSCDNTVDCAKEAVPRDGVEPPTRGFSGPMLAVVRATPSARAGKRIRRGLHGVN